VKLFYSITEKEQEDLKKMRALREKLLNDEITKEDFEKEMNNLANEQLRLV